LLSGAYNYARCQSCGYEGRIETPMVYHDPEKELLLTYFPPALGVPINEQEKMLGTLINQVVNKLPAEKRKAYLLRSQSMLTMQTMVEKVLEADGITHEMIETQQKQLGLIQRLVSTAPEKRKELIKQEEKLIDENFIAVLSRLTEAAASQGDENGAKTLLALQQDILSETEIGRNLKSQVQDTQEAIKMLQEAGKDGLTREKLVELFTKEQSDTRLEALVTLAHSALDYQFFQLLTEKANQATGDEKERLSALRDKILERTSQIEKEMEEQAKQTRKLLEEILSATDVEKATEGHLQDITNIFMDVLDAELQQARSKGDLERSAKLQKIAAVIEKASTPPPEVALIEKLIGAPDDETLNKMMETEAKSITPEFLSMFNSIVLQTEKDKRVSADVMEKLKKTYKAVLKFSMRANLSK